MQGLLLLSGFVGVPGLTAFPEQCSQGWHPLAGFTGVTVAREFPGQWGMAQYLPVLPGQQK